MSGERERSEELADAEGIAGVLAEHYGSLWCPKCHVAASSDYSEPWSPTHHQAEAVAAYLRGDSS